MTHNSLRMKNTGVPLRWIHETNIFALSSFSGTCILPSVKDMMDDIDEKMGKKLKW